MNWLFLGATYTFLYWGRYNLNVAVRALGGPEVVADFNWMFGAGTAIYGVSFLINGPLTDKYGGRFSILLGACGAAVANILMGVACWMSFNNAIETKTLFWLILVLYSYAYTLPEGGAVASTVDQWWFWPIAMIPIAIIGLALSYKIRNEKPKDTAVSH